MRGEQSRLQITSHGQEEEEEEEEEEEDEAGRTNRNKKNERHADIPEASGSQRISRTPAAKLSLMNQQQPDKRSSGNRPLSPVHGGIARATSSHRGPKSLARSDISLSPNPKSSTQDTFSSSFSFIQQSLNMSHRSGATTVTSSQESEPLYQSHKAHHLPQTKSSVEGESTPVQSEGCRADSEEPRPNGRFWQECLWDSRKVRSDLPDLDSLDIELTSSLSVDSDNASASSVTSGYESATPASDLGWDSLVKKYEVVLQDCLQNNRIHAKIESMMLKLQRLQQKAILDDDYDAAERFGKKLEELGKERGALKLGLPSTQPSVARFLERLRLVVHSALQRAQCGHCREGTTPDAAEQSDPVQGPLLRRDRLIQERRLVEGEIAELQQRLADLSDRSRCLGQQIQQEEQQLEAEELEGSVLRSCTVGQLCDMGQTLQDLVTSENRTQISVSPSPAALRLQEQEQALNLSIKEATAKVVMSQRLGSSLRRKVSETETQLLALHEAKLAAISGNDFGSAKELKAEMKAVYLERDRLDALAKRLNSLSAGSSQELARMKEQRQQLRQELERKEAQHESRLKENASKYMKLLEDRLHSCTCPGLERIWEADLEACHLFLRGLQLRTASCGGAEVEDLSPSTVCYLPNQTTAKEAEEEEEEDCAMLTALGGRWCPEANLQNSEFTKKLEEFLFGMEESHAEDGFSEAEAADLTERCELISERLMSLEDELHTAMLNQDQALTQSLEKEVQDVKATLQSMLAQLKEEEGEEEEVEEGEEEEEEEEEDKEGQEEEELQDDDLMQNGTEEEEEDQYFSDSWDI
ncbi:disrupted in schizophrenia 1 protein isoform X2 [Nelusetta ayraudi]